MSDDLTLHAHLVGRQGARADLNTPVLVLDIDALDRNIAAMAGLAAARCIGLRPHAKTHKSVDIAKRQLAAGAAGALADGGVTGILITSPVAAPSAIERLAALATRADGLMATVDHPDVARRIDAALVAQGATLDVLIDIDPGIARTGVASPEKAVDLARAIAALPTLRWRGVQYYCGSQQHIEDYAERRAAIFERTDYLKTVLAALADADFAAEIVSGSGTGTHHIDLDLGVFTEVQAGSYVFMDKQYCDCDLTGDGAVPFEVALGVDARVVSANHSGLVTIDAGFKSLSTDGGVAVVRRGAPTDSFFAFMGDEHAALVAPGIGERMAPGDPVTLTVPHCDPTVNLYDHYHVVAGDTLVAIWPVSARGRAR